MKGLIYLLCFFNWLFPTAGAAAVVSGEMQLNGMANDLRIQPRTCVKQSAADACSISIRIKMAQTPKVDYCLTFNNIIPKQCFAANTPIDISVNLDLLQDTLVQIVSDDGLQVLGQNMLRVAIYQPIQRHSRRFAWGLL